MRGRPRKPTDIKELQGTAQSCRLNPAEPTPTAGVPEMPAGLDEFAAAAWGELADILTGMRVLTKADRHALELCAQAIGDHRRACVELQALDAEQPEDFAQRRKQWTAERNDANKRALTWLAHFGLTPADRSRVSVLGEEKGSRFTERKPVELRVQ